VKAESKAAAGLFARPEWEMPIDGDHPIIVSAVLRPRRSRA
jgi:inorganic triphosphatase YgiF